MTLPIALKQLREELKLQQKELAELLNVNPTTLNRWEAGRTRPTKAIGLSLLHIAKEKGASEVILSGLNDVLNPKFEIEEKTNDLRYAEIDSINQLVNEAPNGVIVIGFDDYKILYMNDKMVELTGVPMEKATTMKCDQLLLCNSCHKEEVCSERFSENFFTSTLYGAFYGKYYVIQTKLITWKGQKALIKYFTDITDLHDLQKKVQLQQEAINFAAQFSGVQVIKYDIQKNTAYLMTNTTYEKGLPTKIDNFDSKVFADNVIHPKFVQKYKHMLHDIKSGIEQTEDEIQVKGINGKYQWLHFQMNITAFDNEGKPLTAIITARIINKEKSMQERIKFEHEKIVADQKNLMAYEISNISQNKLLEYHFFEDPFVIPDDVYDHYFRNHIWCSKWIVGTTNQEKYEELHKRDFLLKSFSEGKSSFSLNYCVKQNNGFEVWIKNSLHLHQDIITGDIDLYEYFQRIDEMKIFEGFLKELINHKYCNFSVLYQKNGQLNTYFFEETRNQKKALVLDYNTEVRKWCNKYVLSEDRDYFLKCTNLQSLPEKLNKKKYLSFFLPI